MSGNGDLSGRSTPVAGGAGYLTRLQEQWYGALAPLYDLMLMWALRPCGGSVPFVAG